MIKYLQLNQFFSAEKMRGDLERLNLCNEEPSAPGEDEAGSFGKEPKWKAHYNTAHYEGSWSVIPLRSLGGKLDNIISLHDGAAPGIPAYEDTSLLKECKYIQAVVQSFECEKTSVRLMKLNAGAVIKNHRDHELSFEDGEVRFHIPVQTNYQVGFFLEEEKIMMKEGECWYLNLTLKHRVQNFGSSDRIHLVIDCKVNDWVKRNFEENTLALKQVDVAHKDQFTPEVTLKIIQQLRVLNTPTALDMAARMEWNFNSISKNPSSPNLLLCPANRPDIVGERRHEITREHI